ncbi:MAG: 16S rRNA (cytidine(1402)-2'-O)-methyltransferase [Bacteroidia bacterium]
MGKLIAVPTPIGNLEDMTYRSVRVLKEVNLILAEDTRTTKKLLNHYGILTPLRAHHQHNEHKIAEKIAEELQADVTYAVVTDAGTPAISDPGFLLIRECLRQGVTVECLPGATAFVPALVNSGLPAHSFTFEGFLPHKKGRMKRLTLLAEEQRTMIFYESPYRLLKSLTEMAEVLGAERRASVSRELTKIFEETIHGTLAELAAHFEEKPIKGELVIVIAGKN